jgi:hypothetical protein
MMQKLLLAVVIAAIPFLAEGRAAAQPTIEQIIKKAEAKFEPADAKPGQTVTLKISLQLLDGWHTYPVTQLDKAAKSQSNKLTLPEGGAVVFVGGVVDPPEPQEKSEPLANIERILYYPGGGAWKCKAVVLPTTAAGTVSSKIAFRVLVCNQDNCLPPKTLDLEATLKVSGEPVAVDPKYKKDVEKAMKK